MSYELWIVISAGLVAASCALVGSFLVLRRLSLLGDAISHSVLLGIVLVYLLLQDTQPFLLLIGALLTGLLTAWLSEWIYRHSGLQKDASLGLVFTWLFALSIVLIALYAEQVHLDHEHVLYGEIAFIPFDRLIIQDLDLGPKAFWLGLTVFLLNALVLIIGYERFKLTSFNSILASTLGIQAAFWHYLLISLVSMTAVASFDLVGSILVVAFLVIPAATAFLITQRLSQLIWLALLFSQIAVWLGFGLAMVLDSSISASMAVIAGLIFFITLAGQSIRNRLNVQQQKRN